MGRSFPDLDSGVQEQRPPFLPSLSSSLWKEAEIREASTDLGDPSMLMPCSVPPPEGWHSLAAPAGTSILPSVLPARRQRRQIPARAWRETCSARGGRRAGMELLPARVPACCPQTWCCLLSLGVWMIGGEDGVWSPELQQHHSLGSLG